MAITIVDREAATEIESSIELIEFTSSSGADAEFYFPYIPRKVEWYRDCDNNTGIPVYIIHWHRSMDLDLVSIMTSTTGAYATSTASDFDIYQVTQTNVDDGDDPASEIGKWKFTIGAGLMATGPTQLFFAYR